MEAAHVVRVERDGAVHDLQRHVLLERGLARLVDGAHRAAAEELLDLVLAGDRATDERGIAAARFVLAGLSLRHRAGV